MKVKFRSAAPLAAGFALPFSGSAMAFDGGAFDPASTAITTRPSSDSATSRRFTSAAAGT